MKFQSIIILVLFGTHTFAQETINETLNQLVRSAIDYAPRIKEQQQTVLMNDFRTKIQESALKPQISTEAQHFNPGKTEIETSQVHFLQYLCGGEYMVSDILSNLIYHGRLCFACKKYFIPNAFHNNSCFTFVRTSPESSTHQ